MTAGAAQTNQGVYRFALEFWLVVVMLAVLTLLVMAVLLIPTKLVIGDAGASDIKDIMLWRKEILSIIITAFGAWVGAGAAYFFGRENLRVAADSLLAMRDLSPQERLRQTSIRQVPPRPLPSNWIVKKTDKINEIKDALLQTPERWFIPIVKDDGTLETVLNEDAVWRYLVSNTPASDASIGDLLRYVEGTDTLKRFNQIYIPVSMETSVSAANDMMDNRHVALAIVLSERKPTHFFTTSDVRKLLLQA